MLDKIKENLSKITFAASITAGALLVPSTLSRLEGQLNEGKVIALIEYLLLLSASILLIIPKTDIKKIIPTANVLFYGAIAFASTYNAIKGNLISSYATAGLYAAVAVLIFIPSAKKGYQITALIATAFLLASALSGGAVNLSFLITSLLISTNYYFNTEKE